MNPGSDRIPGLEDAKRAVEALTGWGRPTGDASALVQPRSAETFRFGDDGAIPNHPFWPLIVYRAAVRFPGKLDPAAVLEDLFHKNGWGGMWRDGIYDYAHYHSQIHEALGVARGAAEVEFGGAGGRILPLKAGDVAILPAGVGHRRVAASKDFLVVGAYPPAGQYDECAKPEDRQGALARIPATPRPLMDPVYGAEGPLLSAWT